MSYMDSPVFIPDNTFEVHEHALISGPRANRSIRIRHAHESGNSSHGGHSHPDTGPAFFTIDKDWWFARTGLRGGGRKEFTTEPAGEQLPLALARGDAGAGVGQ